jgi:hypothetical protein
MTDHLYVPDTQCKEGVPTHHLEALGNYIVAHRPDVIIHAGDHWDFPSLSSWDRGKIQFEGRRYVKDVEAGNAAMDLMLRPLRRLQSQQRVNKKKQYTPRMVFTMGNHEHRVQRAVESSSQYEGLLSYDHLNLGDWDVYGFLTPVEIDGVVYSHFFPNPMTGKPYGGMIDTRLKNIGYSFTQGHQQCFLYGRRDLTNGDVINGMVAGAFYLHEEDYKGPQGNQHFRGIVHKSNVAAGDYDFNLIRINSLIEAYL